ncbi:hypothetical protein [Hamadaea tsunoensis]|uniref:hypothetical protein n=1 Tax=Hamadaea tsunoensis TaxID=53368 RepID=UPI0012F9C0C3|nr:hypothetical protein [Hamadaea tsunoensis]
MIIYVGREPQHAKHRRASSTHRFWPKLHVIGADDTADSVVSSQHLSGAPRQRPGIWHEPDRFFDLESGESLYSYEWTLVGRDTTLNSLVEWLVEDERTAAILDGRGGIGSRDCCVRLHSAALEYSYVVRFLDRSAFVQPEDIEVLPPSDRHQGWKCLRAAPFGNLTRSPTGAARRHLPHRRNQQ